MTTEERADRRQRILESAVEEFAEHGLSGARGDRIAGRAGANKQLIYYYFGDKAGLFDAAVRVMTVRMERSRELRGTVTVPPGFSPAKVRVRILSLSGMTDDNPFGATFPRQWSFASLRGCESCA